MPDIANTFTPPFDTPDTPLYCCEAKIFCASNPFTKPSFVSDV